MTFRPGVTVLVVLFASLLVRAPALLPQVVEESRIDRAIETIQETMGVPGVALAIVRGDSAVFVRGYGVREIGESAPVDESTLFAIGSDTKAFTATLIGMLVDDGILDWDDRVIDRLPGFRLSEPFATSEITIRDLLAHRSGLPPADLMWLSTDAGTDTLLKRLRWLDPLTGFRAAFTYQNLLYVAAGQIASTATGRSWSDLVAERILRPLGMTTTTTSVGALAGRSNVAVPHALVDGAVSAVPYRTVDHVAPAGAINTSASDLARWLKFLLAGGRREGESMIDAATLAETISPQIVISSDAVMDAFYPGARFLTYGMGWFVTDFHGKTLLSHGGGIDGMTALVALVPEAHLGIAIMTNLQTPAPTWIFGMLYGVLDPMLGVEPTDWETPAARLETVLDAMAKDAQMARIEDTRPSHSLDDYAGLYTSPTLGEAQVVRDARGLDFRMGTLTGSLEHWHYDTFRIRWDELAWRALAGPGWMTFRLDRSGVIDGFELRAFPGETELLTRRGDLPADGRP